MKKYTRFFLLISFLIFISCNNYLASKRVASNTASPEKTDWKMGVALYSFHRHPFTTSLNMADSAGVNYIEGFSFYKLGEPFHDSTMGNINADDITVMKKLLEERGISMTSMYVLNGRDAQEWRKYFEVGKSLGLKYLVCEPDKNHWDIIDSLAGLYKIKIAIHEHAKGSGNSKYWHPDSVLAAIKGHSNIGACADLGHWARSGLDVVDCLKKLDGHILGLHVKDVDELGNTNAKDVIPGMGVIDYPAVVAELKRQHFTGYAQVECELNLENNLADVKETIKYFINLSTKNK